MRIRKATKDDAIGIIEHLGKVYEETKFLLMTRNEFHVSVEEEMQWIENIEKNDDLLLVAEDEGKIIGLLNLTKKKHKRVSHIAEFGISIQLEYCNKGLGSKMITYMLDWAIKETDIEKVMLEVFSNNERAIHLYKKFGFMEEGRKKNFIKYEDGSYTDEIIMCKRLEQ